MIYKCNTCKKDLDQSHFYYSKSGKRNPKCKDCCRKAARDLSNSETGKEKRKLAYLKMRENPELVASNKQRGKDFYNSVSGRAKTLLKSAQRRSHKFKESITIDLDFILEKLERGICEVTGLEFDFKPPVNSVKNPFSPSIDRIDSNVGYTKENTRIVLWQINLMKGEMSDEQLFDLCKVIVDKGVFVKNEKLH